AEQAPEDICAHIAEFCNYHQINQIKLTGGLPVLCRWREIDDLRQEVEEPGNVEEAEDCVGNCFQRVAIGGRAKHLAGEDHKEKADEDCRLEVVGMVRPIGALMKEATDHVDRAAQHSC